MRKNYLHLLHDIFSITFTQVTHLLCVQLGTPPLWYPLHLSRKVSTYPTGHGIDCGSNQNAVLPSTHPLILVCIKLHQLLVLLCSFGIPHAPVKNLPVPWSPGFVNGFWGVTSIKSCKAQINYVHQLALAYYINSSGVSDRLRDACLTPEIRFSPVPWPCPIFPADMSESPTGLGQGSVYT